MPSGANTGSRHGSTRTAGEQRPGWRRRDRKRWRSILVCFDDSLSAAQLVSLVRVLGNDPSLALLNVVPVPYALPVGMRRPLADAARDSSLLAQATRRGARMQAVAAELEPRPRLVERRGDFLPVLREAVVELRPDLLVVGSGTVDLVADICGNDARVTPLRPLCDVLVLAGRP